MSDCWWRHFYLIDYQIKCDKAVRKWEAETGESATAFATSKGRFICVSDDRRLKDGDGVLNDAAADDNGALECPRNCDYFNCILHPCRHVTENGRLRKGESPYCSLFCSFLRDAIPRDGSRREPNEYPAADIDVLAWLPW